MTADGPVQAQGPVVEGPPAAPPDGPGGPEDEAAAPRVRRPRAPRTTAAVIVATVVLVVAGALLYDVIAVRAGLPARRWRARIADELATRHLDDPWVLVGAGVAVLLGGTLLWLALAPGLGRWLPLRPHGGTGATIDRAGIGHLLADRAAGLPGVDHLKIRLSRRRIRVTLTGTADPALVERQLRDELARVTLARPPQLDVRSAGGAARDVAPEPETGTSETGTSETGTEMPETGTSETGTEMPETETPGTGTPGTGTGTGAAG
ncbi:DUF6286 domain-containing protein [Kitasatospora sp. NPDC101176]|uniref:DUF6286 domain-containing protein n=1 Tax=Kitasatospora sp. NPDC101176 TaxID=3364099 RepID=UPI003822D48F